MNRRIPHGTWCLWRLNPAGPLEGKVVLAQHADIQDSDLGAYTVKRYTSQSVVGHGGAHLSQVTLSPDSTDPSFMPLVFEALADGELRVIAEFVSVVG